MAHGHRGHGHDALGNPHDFERYLEKLEGPDRKAWQKPDQLVRALELRPRDVVAEVGAGTGYFARRLAKVAGHVWALEAEPKMLEILGERARRIPNLAPVLVPPHDPKLPPGSVDLVLMVNAYHHLDRRYLAKLARVLKPRGRLVNVDFHPDSPLGPRHKVSREEFLADAKKAGLAQLREHDLLEHQYVVELVTR